LLEDLHITRTNPSLIRLKNQSEKCAGISVRRLALMINPYTPFQSGAGPDTGSVRPPGVPLRITPDIFAMASEKSLFLAARDFPCSWSLGLPLSNVVGKQGFSIVCNSLAGL
jgi:hypothetical protein